MSKVNPEDFDLIDSFEPLHRNRPSKASNVDRLYFAKPTEILANLRLGRISVDHAIDYLDRNDSISLLWAGQLAVEKALELNNTESMADALVQAKTLFDRSQAIELHRTDGETNHIVSKARIFNTNLPIYGRALFGGLLPNETIASDIYAKSLVIGVELCDQYNKMINSDPETSKVSTVLGKIAIQSLLQRDSLISRSTMDNFPTLSLLTSYTLDKNRTNRAAVWDIDVLANHHDDRRQLGSIESISRELKVRVHTVPNKFTEEVPARSDIQVVNISPDIKLGTDYNFGIASSIIVDCWQELQSKSGPDLVSARLDTRTTMLKETLYKQAA